MVGARLVSDSVTQSQFIVLKLPLATFQTNCVPMKKKTRTPWCWTSGTHQNRTHVHSVQE